MKYYKRMEKVWRKVYKDDTIMEDMYWGFNEWLNTYGREIIQQLEDELAKMKNINKKLKAQVSEFRNSRRRSTKRNIRRDNEWTAEEGRLADKIVPFCKLYLFPWYKFLKDNWMDYDKENENSFCNFVAEKINEMYPNMRTITRSKREWESVYVPLIGQKYSNMRCNLSNDI
jgi:hypothetical protein